MSPELKRRLIIAEKQTKKEMAEWWELILPRKGSVLRALVDAQLSKYK